MRTLADSRAYILGFSAFPVLALIANNAGDIEFIQGMRSLVVSMALGLLFYGAVRLVIKNPSKAGLLTVIAILIFHSYGHLYDFLKSLQAVEPAWVRHRFLLPLLSIIFGALAILILRGPDRPSLQPAFNAIAAVLVLQTTASITVYRSREIGAQLSAREQRACQVSSPEGEGTPDIYLIILDAYERDDVLREMHGYDNSPFLKALEDRGFYVARGSMSNYRTTEVSIMSTLNMDYVQAMPEIYPPKESSLIRTIERIGRNEVRRQLECLGYITVAIETGVYWTEWRDADFFIEQEMGINDRLHASGRVTRFEVLALQSTILRAGIDLAVLAADSESVLVDSPLAEYRERILFVFDQVPHLASLPGPKFVFIHIISPHPPFVFGAEGEPVSLAEFETTPDLSEARQLAAYADQVTYLNSRVIEAVDAILERSEVPPIIIIQGDHGWADRDAEDKLSILNVYHLPDGGSAALYPTITPVNSFRVVFDRFFGGNYGLLEDLSYSGSAEFTDLEVVENSWSSE